MTNPQDIQQNTVLETYRQGLAAVESELAKLQARASAPVQSPNWSDVGDLQRLLDILRQANGEG